MERLVGMAEEVWKDIIDYEDYYQVSNYGNIKSKNRIVFDNNGIRLRQNKAKIMRFRLGVYKMIGLNKNHIQNQFLVHRLVAKHFVPNPENKSDVNHLDGDKYNNYYLNLRWDTSGDNQKHAYEIGLKKPTWINKKLSDETKRRMSESKKGKPAHNKGLKQPRKKLTLTPTAQKQIGL